MFIVLATDLTRALSLCPCMIKRCSVSLLLGLALALPLHAAGNPSDDQLSKLMVGAWRSPRHDYIYFSDGTWWMGRRSLVFCTVDGESEIIGLRLAAPTRTKEDPIREKAASRLRS